MFMESLKQDQWESVLLSDDAYANFINTFNTLYNLYCPAKKVKIKDTCRKKPWLSNGLKNACRKKNRLYRLFLRDRTEISESRYRTSKNKLTSILRYIIYKPLTNICNNSFKPGVFPSRMKIAKIKPIFKSGAKTEIRNYRPISLLPQFKKKWRN